MFLVLTSLISSIDRVAGVTEGGEEGRVVVAGVACSRMSRMRNHVRSLQRGPLCSTARKRVSDPSTLYRSSKTSRRIKNSSDREATFTKRNDVDGNCICFYLSPDLRALFLSFPSALKTCRPIRPWKIKRRGILHRCARKRRCEARKIWGGGRFIRGAFLARTQGCAGARSQMCGLCLPNTHSIHQRNERGRGGCNMMGMGFGSFFFLPGLLRPHDEDGICWVRGSRKTRDTTCSIVYVDVEIYYSTLYHIRTDL
jgi:hypothetical protein